MSVRLEDMSVLLVDDEPANLMLLQQVLKREGFTCVHGTTDPREVPRLVDELAADIVVLDLHMPHVDGFALLEQLRTVVPRGTYLPRLVVTADVTPQTRRRALDLNAHDFLTKPIDTTETYLRIRNLLQTRRLHRELLAAHDGLEVRVRERTAELEQSVQGAVQALIDTLALACPVALRRAVRVQPQVKAVADDLGWTDAWTELLPALSQLGAVGLSDELLQREESGELLGRSELAVLARIPAMSATLLPRLPSLAHLRDVVRLQTERFDGAEGGPVGDALPEGSRLLRVAFDLDRAKVRGLPVEVALSGLADDPGRYDPVVVEAFTRHLLRVSEQTTRSVELHQLQPGMVLAQDVYTEDGRLLVASGTEVNERLAERLRHFAAVQRLASSLLVLDAPQAVAA